MSTDEPSTSTHHEAVQPGVIPTSRPLRKSKTSELLGETPSHETEEENENISPQVPSRPTRGSSIKSTRESRNPEAMGTNDESEDLNRASDVVEEIVPNIPSRPSHVHPSSKIQEPHIPTRPTHDHNASRHEAEPHIPTRPIKNEAPVDQEIVSEPHIPARPIRKGISIDQTEVNEPHIPARPFIKKLNSADEQIVTLDPQAEPLTTDDTNQSENSTPHISEVQQKISNSVNVSDSEPGSGKVNPEVPQPTEGNNENEEERTGETNKPLSEEDIDDSMQAEPVAEAPITPYANNETGLVEPLMPKRPIRRTTTEVHSPSVPQRPRKAATSIDLETVQTYPSLSLKNLTPTDDMKENNPENGESDFEEIIEDEKKVQPVDIISPGPTDANKYLLEKEEQTIKDINTEKPEPLSENVSDEIMKEITEPVLEKSNELTKDENEGQSRDSTPNSTAKEEQPSIPSRPAKKGPPPVPKKPSSKIAAFHQMLQRQQLKNLGLDDAESEADVQAESPLTPTTEDSTPSQTKSLPTRPSQMVGGVNGMFALPGMVSGGALPPGLSKKLGISQDNENSSSDNSSSKGGLSDVRQKRARGPRGRKLPTKISGIKKVVDSTENNDIEMFNNWTITLTPIEKQENIDAEETATFDNVEEKETSTQPIDIQAPKDNEPVTPQEGEHKPDGIPGDEERLPSQTPISIGEIIELRDDDERPIYLEQQVEKMAESLMEQEMLKGDIDEMEIEENDQAVNFVDDSTPEDETDN
ncbi:similar to Saccharomyces cerevisiae YIR003W AIM21 Protein of unknown function involved in mitochondrial migration along actin filament [Maudiozyma saulgeensis]|uniref:Altered inheritance of mitochondria protein 21 n=1 Tax=Maudiozyma saulgeensis TaxID=1789683 RepID=A0A1X7QWZ3_9SACH|nr:similar to Saccharomyces cerevisiae YIR003W AIM21 Protein of unknown function involved in mitochondrial migration along actin filament [Kazachstania saulgeensis]